MSNEKINIEKLQKGNKLLMIVSVVIVVIAIIGIGILLLGGHSKATGSVQTTTNTQTTTTTAHTATATTEELTKSVEQGSMQPLTKVQGQTKVKEIVLRLKLKEFEELENVTLASPLTPLTRTGPSS